MALYETIRVEKGMYKNGVSLTAQLEAADPSTAYKGTGLSGLDAFQRQLKRFDIRVGGASSDPLEKFFSSAQSAVLFPEYVIRAVRQGISDGNVLESLCASITKINALDYRSIDCSPEDNNATAATAEGGELPKTVLSLKNNLVSMKKRGRLLTASYEALRLQRLDLFTVALRQIGQCIMRGHMEDAVNILMNGDGNGNPADVLLTAATGTITYADLISLWGSFTDFEMNTILASPDMMQKLITMEEMQDAVAGLSFHGTGRMVTPLGAALIQSSAVPADSIVALDKRFALEMVTCGDVVTDHDKLISCQLERAAVSLTAGFAKLFPDAVKVMKLS